MDRLDPGKAALPATGKQQKKAEQLLRDFPSSLAKRENYVDYIAKRPRAERFGAHGPFTGADGPLVLFQVADTAAAHPVPIISLRREDTARLGYDNAGMI